MNELKNNAALKSQHTLAIFSKMFLFLTQYVFGSRSLEHLPFEPTLGLQTNAMTDAVPMATIDDGILEKHSKVLSLQSWNFKHLKHQPRMTTFQSKYNLYKGGRFKVKLIDLTIHRLTFGCFDSESAKNVECHFDYFVHRGGGEKNRGLIQDDLGKKP